tara:strand:- start:23 stop:898 length:876 start_codon:yes stop_codon:yes gene_type:complete
VEVMIDLEKKGKIATGLKKATKWTYKLNQETDFKISRGKYDNYKDCPRCFYLDVVKGFKEPKPPGWALNSRTDDLLKKEFDLCREKEISHKFLINKGLGHIIPYKNNNIAKDVDGNVIKYSKTKVPYKIMDAWRTQSHGLQARFKKTKFILYGAVDDIWLDKKNNALIIVDYKSQAKDEAVSQDTYFDAEYKEGYKRQLEFYAYLLKAQNLDNKISDTGFLYVVNARGKEDKFDNKLIFEPALISVKIENDDLDDDIQKMIDVIKSTKIPQAATRCKNCAYARQRSKTDTL